MKQKQEGIMPEYQINPSKMEKGRVILETEDERQVGEKVEIPKIPQWIINEARIVNEALEKGKLTKKEAQEGMWKGKEMADLMKKLINIRFFVESHPEGGDRAEELRKIFSEETMRALQEKGWGVSLAMIDLDKDLAEIVRQLNQRNIPVSAWVVLEDIEGYWTNVTNIPETKKKTEAIRAWAQENNLQLDTYGLDSEMPLELTEELLIGKYKRLLTWLRKFHKVRKQYKEKGTSPEKEIAALTRELKEEGAAVETYEYPRPLSLVAGLLGVLEAKVADRRLSMVYSSGLPKFLRSAFVKHFRPKGTAPAIGIAASSKGRYPGRGTGEGVPLLDEQGVKADVAKVLEQAINVGNREIKIKDLYCFALNDLEVALWMQRALEESKGAKGTGA